MLPIRPSPRPSASPPWSASMSSPTRSLKPEEAPPENSGVLLIEELLKVREAGAAVSPAHPFIGIDHRRGLTDRELKPGDGLDELTALVIDHDGAPLGPVAI